MKVSTTKKKTNNAIVVRKGTGTTLVIDAHEVHGNPIKQTIRWELDTSLSDGDFTSFEWAPPAPATGTFDTPEIAYDGNSLVMGDLNGTSAQKDVRHDYVIKVDLHGVTYTSTTSAAAAIISDPVIINR